MVTKFIVEDSSLVVGETSFEKATYAAMTLHYASIWYNINYGPDNWHIPECFAGRRFEHAWKTIKFEYGA